jgi:hypothetical protein
MMVVEVDDITGTDAPYLWAIVEDDGSVVDRFDSREAAESALPDYVIS